MAKSKNKRTIIINLIIILLLSISIGYAAIENKINIKGSSTIGANSWIIYFDNITTRVDSIEANIEANTPTEEKNSIFFDINLTNSKEIYSFETEIVNDGTVDAMIEEITLEGIPEEYNNSIEWQAKYTYGDELQKCDELLAGTRRKIIFKIKRKDDLTLDSLNLTPTFKIKYVVLDEAECPIIHEKEEPQKHTLKINPNGGIYKNSRGLTEVEIYKGDTFYIENPTYIANTFDGWIQSQDGIYNPETSEITMGDENIEITAKWIWNNMCFSIENNQYETFNDAITSISTTGTINLLHDGCTITTPGDEEITINNGQDITINLNSFKATALKNITNKGTLTITDTTEENKGEYTFSTDNTSAITNNNTIQINKGKFNVTKLLNNTTSTAATISNTTISITGTEDDKEAITSINSPLIISETIIKGKMSKGINTTGENGSLTISTSKIEIENQENLTAINAENNVTATNVEINIHDSTGDINGFLLGTTYNLDEIDLITNDITVTNFNGIKSTEEEYDNAKLNHINMNINYIDASSIYGIQNTGIDLLNSEIIINQTTDTPSNETTTLYAYNGTDTNQPVTIDNLNIETNTRNSSGVLIYASGGGELTNIIINANIDQIVYGSTYGILINELAKIKGVDITINAPQTANLDGIYAFKRGKQASDYEDITMNLECMNQVKAFEINAAYNMKNINVTSKAQVFAYGIYGYWYTSKIEDSEFNIETDYNGTAIFNAKELQMTNTKVNMKSNRVPPRGSTQAMLFGVDGLAYGTITDSEITVEGNYGEATDEVNNNVITIRFGSNAETDILNIVNSKISSTAYCFKTKPNNTINVDASSTLTYGARALFDETVGTLNIDN